MTEVVHIALLDDLQENLNRRKKVIDKVTQAEGWPFKPAVKTFQYVDDVESAFKKNFFYVILSDVFMRGQGNENQIATAEEGAGKITKWLQDQKRKDPDRFGPVQLLWISQRSEVEQELSECLFPLRDQGEKWIDFLSPIENIGGEARFVQAIKEAYDRVREERLKISQKKGELVCVESPLGEITKNLEKYIYNNIIGQSPAMQKVYQLLEKIVATHHPVFIHGESGTGKELIAKAIHYNGSRKERPFVAENCAAISENLMEAELFGYEKGAFTGADRDKKGLFEIADGGTLLLDEVGDMSRGMQAKLLRVLQEGELRRVGGQNIIPVDVRIISASNKDLLALVNNGIFREDLYYRLNVITINLPPLRDRDEDILLLADYFLKEIATKKQNRPKKMTSGVIELLRAHEWKGNIRELHNVIFCAEAFSATDATTIDIDNLPDSIKSSPEEREKSSLRSMSFWEKNILDVIEKVEKAKGTRMDIYEHLSCSQSTFYNKLQQSEAIKARYKEFQDKSKHW